MTQGAKGGGVTVLIPSPKIALGQGFLGWSSYLQMQNVAMRRYSSDRLPDFQAEV